MQVSQRISELDGLRGIAILAVTAYHLRIFLPDWLRPIVNCGWMGVDLFFVISGFLITGILLEQRGKPGYYVEFYARRAVRIWPLYFILLLTVAAVSLVAAGPRTQHSPIWMYLLYVQNLTGGVWYPLNPTWSLAIEEQFYLIWPLLISLCRPRSLRWVLAGILIGSPLVRAGVFAFTSDWHRVYLTTFCRLDGLACGALLALLISSLHVDIRKLRAYGLLCMTVGTAATFWLVQATDCYRQDSVLLYSAIALMSVGILAAALGRNRFVISVLNPRPLRQVGTLSYGIYLLQFPAFTISNALTKILAAQTDLVVTPWATVLMRCGINFGLAALSWHYLESPLLRRKNSLASAAHKLFSSGHRTNKPEPA